MQYAPVGIVKAKAKGLDQPQWLVNIGGSIVEVETTSASAVAAAQPKTDAAKPAAPAASDAVGPAEPATPPAPAPTPKAAAQQPAQTSTSTTQGFEVKGGLAIPLYVVLLAMLGAGINMTRKVPEIQADYDSNASATLHGALSAPIAVLGMKQSTNGAATSTKDPSVIRRDLIETYMYFLSAPFLAVAVYYLLQVLATSVAEPVLVVIAFASGLMSNATVGAIMAFADSTLERLKKPGNPAAEQHPKLAPAP
jgi:hypothetical protein